MKAISATSNGRYRSSAAEGAIRGIKADRRSLKIPREPLFLPAGLFGPATQEINSTIPAYTPPVLLSSKGNLGFVTVRVHLILDGRPVRDARVTGDDLCF